METLHIHGANELISLAETVLSKLRKVKSEDKTAVLALSGGLGAGKTTFIQALAGVLGVEESVISPTYVIMKRYVLPEKDADSFKTLVHLDVYRIEDIAEMAPLHFEEVLKEKEALVCIEWAEKIKELLPPHTLYMDIKEVGESEREVTLSYHD